MERHYHCTFEVSLPPAEAFAGINRVSAWWAQELKGSSENLNDIFTVYFGKTWGSYRITEFIPARKIVWHTTDCHLDLLKNPKEWKGTDIVFELEPAGNGTRINMTHVGLSPGLECFEDCNKGWDFFLKESLFDFLEKQKGLPGTGIRATINGCGQTYRGTLFTKEQRLPEKTEGLIIIDVKATAVEHVAEAYSVRHLNPGFELSLLKGDYYMLIENEDESTLECISENVISD